MAKFKLMILGFTIIAIAGGFLFRDIIFEFYKSVGKNLKNFQQSELGTVISHVGEVLMPPPLNIGGKANSVVLTKDQVIIETNVQRNENGLPSLSESLKLNQAALVKARDMFAEQYFEHVSPQGTDPGTLVKSAGYNFIVTGENLILGNFTSEKEMVRLWMESPGHRANILNIRFREMGVAVVKGTYNGQAVWIGVQEFGLPFSSCPKIDEALKRQIEINKAELDVLSSKIDAKRDEIEDTSRRSEKYNQLVDEYNALVAEYNQLNEKTKALISTYNAEVNNFNKCVSGQ